MHVYCIYIVAEFQIQFSPNSRSTSNQVLPAGGEVPNMALNFFRRRSTIASRLWPAIVGATVLAAAYTERASSFASNRSMRCSSCVSSMLPDPGFLPRLPALLAVLPRVGLATGDDIRALGPASEMRGWSSRGIFSPFRRSQFTKCRGSTCSSLAVPVHPRRNVDRERHAGARPCQ